MMCTVLALIHMFCTTQYHTLRIVCLVLQKDEPVKLYLELRAKHFPYELTYFRNRTRILMVLEYLEEERNITKDSADYERLKEEVLQEAYKPPAFTTLSCSSSVIL